MSSKLPEGFAIDSPDLNKPYALPQGFVIDSPGSTGPIPAMDVMGTRSQVAPVPKPQQFENIYVDRIASAYPESFRFDAQGLDQGQAARVITGFDTRTGQPIYAGGLEIPKYDKKKILSSIARPVLEAGGSVGGALLASPTSPVGMAAGGGLGYAIGGEAADILDQFLGLQEADSLPEELKEGAKRIVMGTAMEMGGQAAAVGVGAALKAGGGLLRKLPALTAKGAQLRAGEVIAANTLSGPVISKNIDDAAKLEQEIPGLKFSKGQLTNDPNFIKFERAQERGPYGFAADSIEAKTRNTEAITDYVNKIKGKGSLEDVRATGEVTRGKLGESVTAAEAGLELETSAMGRGMGPQDVGRQIKEIAIEGERAAAKEAGKLFEDIPDIQLDGSALVKKIDELSKPLFRFEKVGKNIPEVFEDVKEILGETGGSVSPADLQGLRSMITDDLRDLGKAAQPNNKLKKRLTGFLKSVDEVFEEAGEVVPKERKVSAADMAEYEAALVKSRESAPRRIEELNIKEDFEARKTAIKHGEELAQESSTYADWSEAVRGGGINLENAYMNSDADTIKALMRQRPGLFKSGGSLHSDTFANEKGYDTADEMFQSWLKAGTKKASAEKFADDLYSEYEIGSDMERAFMQDERIVGAEISEFNKQLSKTQKPAGKEIVPKSAESVRAAEQLKSARKAWKKDYIEKFKQGTVNDILRKGPDGADKVQSGQIAGRFFKPGVAGMDAADDFIKAIGDDPKAKEAIRDYVRQDMIANAKNSTTGEITTQGLNRWKAKYKRALEKFGLSKEFDTIEKARKQLDQAVVAQAEFEKSAAAKLLDADPLKAVQSALGKGSKASAAHSLMSKITDDRMAVAGLQNAMVDHILLKDVGELRTIAKMDALIKEYEPALRVVFEANPKKYASIKTVRNAVKVMGRTNVSPLGGGSDTAENILTTMAKEGGMSTWKLAGVIQAAMTPFKQLSEANVNKFINRAILDPEYARTLTMMAKGGHESLTITRLKGQLSKLGIMATFGEAPEKKTKSSGVRVPKLTM